jgi:uncharacterized protein YndB with AHSA1/START domain
VDGADLLIHEAAIVRAQMLIRRPVEEVYRAFVDPSVTTRFWFTRSSGRLEAGRIVQWEWEMYGASALVKVTEMIENERIVIEWDEPPIPVEWIFQPRSDGTTLVTITNQGFAGSDEDVVRQAIDSMGGFTMVLAGLKAQLEHGIELNLVADHHPDAHIGPDV